MKWGALIAALALAACNQPRGADGYSFERAEFTRSEISVRVVQYDTRAAFERAARSLGVADPGTVAAFGQVDPVEPACTIHVMRIAEHYHPEWLGHELTHCIHGRWHPRQNGGAL